MKQRDHQENGTVRSAEKLRPKWFSIGLVHRVRLCTFRACWRSRSTSTRQLETLSTPPLPMGTLSSRTFPIGGFVAPCPPMRPHVAPTGTGRARGWLCRRREEALVLQLVLGKTAGAEAGRGRGSCFTARGCGVRLNVCCLTESRGWGLDDRRASRRLLSKRALAKCGLPGGSKRRQSRMIAGRPTRRFGRSGGCAVCSGTWEVWTVETGGRPGTSDGALGPYAMSGLGGQHRVDHRIVDCVFRARSLRAFGIASVGVRGSSDGSLLTSLFFCYGHASQLGLGRLLVTFSQTLVPLSLRIVDHPITSLPRIGDRPWDLAEGLVQRQVVANGALKRVRSISDPDHD